MLMPFLIAQAICFIHLFGLQLCLAMRPEDRSGPSTSIQIPDADDQADMNYRPVLALRLTDYEFIHRAMYYITVTENRGKKLLKLTKREKEALPIWDSSGLGDVLQVVRRFQNVL
jgi:hypothetical protein